MKTVPLKVTALKNPDGEGMLTYADLLRLCLEHQPQGGFSLPDMRARLKILDLMEEAGKTGRDLFLEDAQAHVLSRCVQNMVWAKLSPGLLVFCDDVIEACM